jgi:hypothetical protein
MYASGESVCILQAEDSETMRVGDECVAGCIKAEDGKTMSVSSSKCVAGCSWHKQVGSWARTAARKW